MSFSIIPALDLLAGRIVRLREGDFSSPTFYDDAFELVDRWPAGTLLHVVDLEAARSGRPIELELVRALVRKGFRLQVGGGVRSIDDARTWLGIGADRVIIGTVACDQPQLFRSIVEAVGSEKVLPALDIRCGEVRTHGWIATGARTIEETLKVVEGAGCSEALVTDVSRDGKMGGPSFALYRSLAELTPLRIIASGGVTTKRDVDALSRLKNVSGAVVGKAILERRIDALARPETSLLPRIIPCLDVRNGRVAKGVRFEGLRDAGDPAELAARYEAEGADEIVLLDIVATPERRGAALETVARVADLLSIPFTVGGGVRSLEDFRALLMAGADRVAINSAAVARPELLREAASEFGVQAVVLACDVAGGGAGEVMVGGGRFPTGLDAVEWCRRAEQEGAGEILLTSIDRDGTHAGFDVTLLRRISSAVQVGVIASGGAGTLEHFRDAIEEGGCSAVLAASLFHDRVLSIRDVKRFLRDAGIPMRRSAA